jgi:transposase
LAEGFSKPPAPSRAERRAAARKQGKQPAAPGKHLAQVAEPDHVVHHAPPSCSSCGSDLDDAEKVDTERRQVFELPEIRLVVTEDIAERRRCRCGCTTKATFPDVATAPACYGPGIRDRAAYLAAHQDLPFDRMAQLLSDVLGAPVSVGTRAQMVTEAGPATKPFLDATRNLLHEAPVVHFDEPGGRAVGRSVDSTGSVRPRPACSPWSTAIPKPGRLANSQFGQRRRQQPRIFTPPLQLGIWYLPAVSAAYGPL